MIEYFSMLKDFISVCKKIEFSVRFRCALTNVSAVYGYSPFVTFHIQLANIVSNTGIHTSLRFKHKFTLSQILQSVVFCIKTSIGIHTVIISNAGNSIRAKAFCCITASHTCPCIKARKPRVVPHPGHGNPVTHLNGHCHHEPIPAFGVEILQSNHPQASSVSNESCM